MKISGAKTVLRRRKFFNSCPTQALCLMLVSGIVIAHFHVVTLPPSYWLLIMLAASAFAILVKNELHKSLLILSRKSRTANPQRHVPTAICRRSTAPV